jgi:hypothetical protein
MPHRILSVCMSDYPLMGILQSHFWMIISARVCLGLCSYLLARKNMVHAFEAFFCLG